MKSLTPNTLLQNRYLVVQLIGKGGMGEVYLAVDQRLGSAVALKRTFFTDDEMLGSAFEREARTLARLRHPVLPKVSDHFIEDENQYLVMEHISGDDLSKRLENAKKPFPLNWVLFWADQLLDALHYLHSHNPSIIHRDIKPQNLKLTDDNHIVLLDFGLAKDNVGQTRVTSSGSVVGFTPHYAPMEQIRGIGTDPRSDIYSLSATLYQLLTNVVPADALTRADGLLNKMPDPLIPVSELNPEVSRPISDVIVKAMGLSLDQRISSAREMQKLLRDGYAQMQNAMSAQTVAFNLKTDGKKISTVEQPEIAPPVAENLDQFATVINSKTDLSSQNSAPISDKTEQMNFAEFAEKNGDSVSSVTDSQPKQSDLKTEVFLAGSESLPTVEDESAQSFDSLSKPSAADSASKNSVSDVSYKKEANDVPSEAPPAFDSVQVSGESAENAFNFSPSEDFSDVEEVYSDSTYDAAGAGFTQPNYDVPESDYSKEEKLSPPPPKKSGGNGAYIAGGIFLLLILIVGAAGAGWYMYNSSGDTVEKPQPTPEIAPSAVPTPEPTAEVADTEDNANTDTDSGLTDNTSGDNTNVQTTTETVTDNNPRTVPKQPVKQTDAQKPQRPADVPKPPKQQDVPKPPKELPKPPTPKKDDRTVPLP